MFLSLSFSLLNLSFLQFTFCFIWNGENWICWKKIKIPWKIKFGKKYIILWAPKKKLFWFCVHLWYHSRSGDDLCADRCHQTSGNLWRRDGDIYPSPQTDISVPIWWRLVWLCFGRVDGWPPPNTLHLPTTPSTYFWHFTKVSEREGDISNNSNNKTLIESAQGDDRESISDDRCAAYLHNWDVQSEC